MNLSVRASGAWQHTLEIELPADEVERRLDEAARGIQRRASLPGFRRGRVPLAMVRQQFADSVEQEFLESTVPAVTNDAVQQAKLEPVIPALVRNLRFTPGQPLRFDAVVEVRPEVEVRDYRGLPLTRRTRAVDDEAVARTLERLREESAVFEDVERAAGRGDFVLLDSVRLDANARPLQHSRSRGLRVHLGAPDLMPDLENGLLGAEAGQERTIEVGYPADHPTAELAGQRVRYRVRVRRIQEQKLRELDDNLARDVFRLESLEALRARVRENLEEEERLRVRREVEGAVTEELIRRNPFDLPERLTQWMLERVIREAVGDRPVADALRAELERRYRPGVERSLKREVLLGGIARQEKLTVSDEEVAQEIERMALAEPRMGARVRARYQAAERREGLRETLLERKAFALVEEQAEVHEETVEDAPRIVPATR